MNNFSASDSNLRFFCPVHLWRFFLKKSTPISAPLPLLDLCDIQVGKIPQAYARHTRVLQEHANWVTNFLTHPNELLGRTGSVCPFVRGSIAKSLFKVVIYNRWPLEENDIIQVVQEFKKVFLQLQPTTGKQAIFKTINILFPNMPAERYVKLIDGVQKKLKPLFVSEGLMLGQFHKNCLQGGLRNENFKPLQAPIPLLAIRNMVETDWPFLVGNAILEKGYKRVFGNDNYEQMKADFKL